MATKKEKQKIRRLQRLAGVLAVILLLLGAWLFGEEETPAPVAAPTPRPLPAGQPMTVRFIDVGQGASTLISMGDTHILIDAGENDRGKTVVQALRSWGVKKLALAIGTHPHSDHIGGMDTVLKAIPTEKYLMPDVSHTSKTFNDVLDVLEEKDIPTEFPKPGDTYLVGGMALTVLAPEKADEGDLNNCSLVCRIDSAYGSVLIPGDAESGIEGEMLNGGWTLKADVLQLSHHGSHTSNTQAFLEAVAPQAVVIPVGKGNDYGHPHQEVLQRLEALEIPAYRTDRDGIVTCVMDEAGVRFTTQK